MSRRKDQARFDAMKRLDPDHRGFRGSAHESDRPGKAPLEPVICSVCGRRRNVPRGIALEQGDAFVCQRCVDEGRAATSTTVGAVAAQPQRPAFDEPPKTLPRGAVALNEVR